MNIPNLFNIILQATIAGSVVGLIIFALKSTLLKRLSARWQYWLWSVMIIKLIFPKGPQSSISVFNKIKVSAIMSEEELLKTATRIAPTAMHEQSIFELIAYIWVAGFIIMLVWTILSFGIMSFKIRRSSSPASQKCLEILERCKKTVGVKRNIRLIVQNHISSPSLCGIIRPAILITKHFEKSDISHIEHSFIHELSHYRRKDIAMNYLLLILQTVHWFNPVSWFLFGKIRRDTELATDEKTMLCITPSEHKDYGMALINALSDYTGKAPAILGMANGRQDIKKRIRAIAKFKKPSFIQHISGIVIMALIASVCLTSAVIAKPISNIIYHSIPNIERVNIPNTSTHLTVPIEDAEEFKAETDEETIQAPPEQEALPTEEIPEETIPAKTDSAYEYTNPYNYSIERIISDTGQVIHNGGEVTDMKSSARLISFNSDSTETQSFIAKPNSGGYIQVFIEEDGYDYEVRVNVSNTHTPGRGWDYRINTGWLRPVYMDGLDPNEEYIITIDTYCPGFYGIEGMALIY